MDPVETACLLLVVLFGLLLYCYTNNKNNNEEGFGMDNRPFDAENTLFLRNPWDDVDYIVPEYNKRWVIIKGKTL